LRVCLDEGVPEQVAEYLPGHDVRNVRELGLKGVKNGKLLAQVEAREFEAFITNDKRLEAEGQPRRRPFGILVLSVTNWELMKPHVAKVAEALERAVPGSIEKIDCGRFIPRSRRKPDNPPI
jgi:hypothetical protein